MNSVKVDELWSLDPEVSANLGKIYGLIFLFKWDGRKETQSQVPKKFLESDIEVIFAGSILNQFCFFFFHVCFKKTKNGARYQYERVLARFLVLFDKERRFY